MAGLLAASGLALWFLQPRLLIKASQKIKKGLDILVARMQEQGPRVVYLWIRDHTLRRIQGVSPVSTCRVAPGLFVGGQHYPHGLNRMAALGIQASLSLRAETDDQARGVALDRHLWLPVIDDTPPTLDQLDRAVRFVQQARRDGLGVYVHCAAGVGRAPTTAAAFLLSTGLTPAEAWTVIRRARPFIRPKRSQFEQLDRFYRSSLQEARQ